jgi:NAD+ kinase
VSAAGDHYEIRDVLRVDVEQDNDVELLMMFDAGHDLDERILLEQFQY